MTEELIRQYLRETKKNVSCSTRRKRAFLAELKIELREFAQETPDLTMEQLNDAFGTPQQRAQDFMETLDAKEVKKAFTWKRVILIGVIIGLLIWGTVAVVALIDGHTHIHGRGEEYLIDENSNYVLITEEYY